MSSIPNKDIGQETLSRKLFAYLLHRHHVVKSFIQLLGDVTVVELLVHQRFEEAVNGCFKLVDGTLGEFSTGIGQFEFFLKFGNLVFVFVFFFSVLDGNCFGFLDLRFLLTDLK